MIITVGNTKGGVGKTTIAINLAILRSTYKEVLLIDGDEQGSATIFTQLRSEILGKSSYTNINLYGTSIRTQVKLLQLKYDDIIIDVGGRDTDSLRAALTVSDILLMPIQTRSFDIWALEKMHSLIEEAKVVNPDMKSIAFLNSADSPGKDNEAAADAIKEYKNIEYFSSPIIRRKSFPNAASIGRSVLETQIKDLKAIEEIKKLNEHISISY